MGRASGNLTVSCSTFPLWHFAELLLAEQKAIKIEALLAEVMNENREIVRSLSALNTRLDAASLELFKTRKVHEKGEQECEVAHHQATERLRDAEMAVLNLEQELKDLGKEIEDCKQEVLEKHREALSWETKCKMSSEAKKFKDEETTQNSEIGIMKAEIHRMQVRYGQLKRMQEKLVHDLENTVHHRENIFESVNAREKVFGGKFKTRSTMQHKINELKNKLKVVFSVSLEWSVLILLFIVTTFPRSYRQRLASEKFIRYPTPYTQ